MLQKMPDPPAIESAFFMIQAIALFLAALLLAGAVFRGSSVVMAWWQVRQKSHWPQIYAEILQAELERVTPESEAEHLQRFFPRVVVRFELRGKTYRIVEEGASMPVAAAERFIAQFTPREQVRVFYKPDNPHDATILSHDATLNRQLYLLGVALLLGLGLLLIGLGVI